MHHVRGPIITLNGQRLALDLIWIGPALLLSIPTGWIVARALWPDASVGAKIVATGLAPLAILSIPLLFEFIRTAIDQRDGTTGPLRQFGPLGSMETSYRTAVSPRSELLREMKSVTIGLILGSVLFLPAYVITGQDPYHPLALPGALIGAFAIINLLPTLPMSGGAILRAIFWFLHDSHTTGTRAAFLYSQLVASAAIGFGVFFLIWEPENAVFAFWLLLIAVVILQASRRELLRSAITERTEDIVAADALSGLNPTIRAAAPLTEAIDILLEQRSNGPALVRDRNVYTGMLNLKTVRATPRSRWTSLTAADLTIPFEELIDTDPGASLLTVLRTWQQNDERTVIVRERDGKIIGLVDETMDHRLLMRRGIARTIEGAGRDAASREDSRTS